LVRRILVRAAHSSFPASLVDALETSNITSIVERSVSSRKRLNLIKYSILPAIITIDGHVSRNIDKGVDRKFDFSFLAQKMMVLA
jgi:hypothetical protein